MVLEFCALDDHMVLRINEAFIVAKKQHMVLRINEGFIVAKKQHIYSD